MRAGTAGLTALTLLLAATTVAEALSPQEAAERARALAASRPPPPPRPGAGALDPTAPWAERFVAMDGDGDGRLTHAEARVYSDRLFTAADRNGDGRIDAAEFAARWGKPIPPGAGASYVAAQEQALATLFAQMDGNRDGVVDRAEAMSATDVAFARADVSRRGAIFRWEFRRFPW